MSRPQKQAKPKPKKSPAKGMDWRDLAASVPQPSKPIRGKLPF